MSSGEYHVASFVVSVRPGVGAQVAATIAALPGLEVHAEEGAKLIVTAEAGDVRELAQRVQSLESVESIIAVAPVYHEFADGEESVAARPHEPAR